MAKGSIFDRADALRRSSRLGAPGKGDNQATPGEPGEASHPTRVRRKVAGKAEAEAAPQATEEAPVRRVVRRRARAAEAPAPAAAPPVAATPAIEAAEPEAVEATTPAPAQEPAAAAPQDAPAEAEASVSVDSLLADGAGAAKRVHKVLSDDEVEADKKTPTAPRKKAAKDKDKEQAAKDKDKEQAAKAKDPAKAATKADAEAPAEATEAAEKPAAAAEPVAAKAAAEAGAEPDGSSLESLLKEQGIVQHKPKKGRRIIEDSITASTAAAAARRPAAVPGAPATPGAPQPPRSGVSLFAQDKGKRGPVRFINEQDIAAERAKKKQRGKGKKVVQRHDVLYGVERRRGRGKARGSNRSGQSTNITTPAAHKRVVRVHGTISVGDLANAVGVKSGVVMKSLISMGMMVTLNEHVDLDTAQLVAQEFDYEAEDVSFKEDEVLFGAPASGDAEDAEVGESTGRAPVVTIMGHVDHGKTTLLDAIRSTSVADAEAGGITQHISAFDVDAGGQQITFVDTPGHAAFTAMRARGAQITDIVILVVAVTEGVMPQTLEVISHARAAEVPIIVALNKIDMPEANADRTRQQLSEHELISESWGGDTQMVELSAKEGTGIDKLLESISLQAEIMELSAPVDCSAQGRVVEAQLEKGRGPVAVAIVQKGTLHLGDVVVAGTEYGKVRALTATDGSNAKLKEAGPSSPVCILGLSGLPEAGDEFTVVKTEKDAKLVTEHRRDTLRASSAANIPPRVSLDDVFERLKAGDSKELNLIIKADVQGSVEALKQVLSEIEVRDVKIRILHSGVGGVTEGDVTLASASEAVIVGFCVRPDAKARQLAEDSGVDVRTYRVIYKVVDEIKQALVGMLEPEYVEKVMGHAEVREVFKVSKVGSIAGSFIQDGNVNRNQQARLLRNSVVIWEGKVGSLRRFKDDVREVLQGYECGIGLEGYDDVKAEDVIETFITEEVRPTA
jgi:translation initiation factor IF-2